MLSDIYNGIRYITKKYTSSNTEFINNLLSTRTTASSSYSNLFFLEYAGAQERLRINRNFIPDSSILQDVGTLIKNALIEVFEELPEYSFIMDMFNNDITSISIDNNTEEFINTHQVVLDNNQYQIKFLKTNSPDPTVEYKYIY